MQHPRARDSDPLTSHEAADMVANLAATHHRILLDALGRGAASAEQIGDITGIPAYAVRKRLPELQRVGFIAPTGGMRKTRSGRSERVWSIR